MNPAPNSRQLLTVMAGLMLLMLLSGALARLI